MAKWRLTIRFLPYALAALLCASCGTVTDDDIVGSNADGGFEAGNPPAPTTTRSLTGEVERSDSATLARFVSTSESAAQNCVADAVVAESSSGEETSAEVDGDCRFAIELTVGTAYSLHFELGGGFVGALVFSNNPDAFDSAVLVVAAGDEDIDVGLISIADGVAIPQNSPAAQNDQDGDGVSDADDDDDDGNGTTDLAEEDCDLDGISDAIDAILSDCDDGNATGDSDNASDSEATEGETAEGEETIDGETTNEGDQTGGSQSGGTETGAVEASPETAAVLEVLPRNNAGIEAAISAPVLTATVALRVDCVIDFASVTSASFRVEDESSAAIACEYSLGGSGDVVGCSHAASPFVSLGVYTATVSGMACEDGVSVESRSWTWKALGLGL